MKEKKEGGGRTRDHSAGLILGKGRAKEGESGSKSLRVQCSWRKLLGRPRGHLEAKAAPEEAHVMQEGACTGACLTAKHRP